MLLLKGCLVVRFGNVARKSPKTVIGLWVVIVSGVLLSACTYSDKIGVVNGCDGPVEVNAHIGNDVYEWQLVAPDAGIRVATVVRRSDDEYFEVRARANRNLTLFATYGDLLSGSSDDWDLEYRLTEADCAKIQ